MVPLLFFFFFFAACAVDTYQSNPVTVGTSCTVCPVGYSTSGAVRSTSCSAYCAPAHGGPNCAGESNVFNM